MEKKDLSRRDFIKGTAITAVATAAVLSGKEIIEDHITEAQIDDLTTLNEPPQISCLDYLNAFMNQKS